ncbi:MAG TPA: 16S rRNA (uracil(1498)-N(3))-methyltransferase [Nitrospiraceae bacterium]|nr:16S rRNA (uracil(1498)-N(3))-methyltransferase [Nitrospiraceae bacterium]
MPVFFIAAPDLTDGVLTITGPLVDHLRKSLRVAVGEKLWVGDDRRKRYFIQITTITPRQLRGHVLEEREGSQPRHPMVILAQAILKGDRMDWVIQKATELGAASIVPIISERVIARPRLERLGSQQERWQRIALEAAQQAERWDVPEVHPPVEFNSWLRSSPRELKLILSERSDEGGLAMIALPEDAKSRILLVIGPEGGWSAAEREAAHASGCTSVSLGPRILRAETATVAAVTIIQSRLGELG